MKHNKQDATADNTTESAELQICTPATSATDGAADQMCSPAARAGISAPSGNCQTVEKPVVTLPERLTRLTVAARSATATQDIIAIERRVQAMVNAIQRDLAVGELRYEVKR